MANFFIFISFVVLAFHAGCGVKGDPLPPEKPPSIGRGQPNFKRATENLSLPKTTREERPRFDKENDPDDFEEDSSEPGDDYGDE